MEFDTCDFVSQSLVLWIMAQRIYYIDKQNTKEAKIQRAKNENEC